MFVVGWVTLHRGIGESEYKKGILWLKPNTYLAETMC